MRFCIVWNVSAVCEWNCGGRKVPYSKQSIEFLLQIIELLYMSQRVPILCLRERKTVKQTVQDYKQVLLTGLREKFDIDKV